jgi:hypothetical protein
MDMHPKEQQIQQRRTIDAATKNYLGVSGKFGTIVRHLGSMIVSQDGGLYDVRYLETEPPPPADPEAIPMFEDAGSNVIGAVFDGLSRGMHLEIKYIKHSAELTVHYKGYLVYQEVAGDLYCFNPFPEWETMIEKLYVVAKKVHDQYQADMTERNYNEGVAEKAGFLERLRMRWGI